MSYSSYHFAFTDHVSDAEISRVFEMTQAIGPEAVTGTANPPVIARIDTAAKIHKMRVGIKNSSPDETSIVTADDIQAACRGASDYIGVALDIGDLTAAGGDPIAFVQQHHGDLVSVYLKDRKKDNGPAVHFGQGDTPMEEVLGVLREKGSAIPVNIRYEYDGADTFRETREGYRFCQRVLG